MENSKLIGEEIIMKDHVIEYSENEYIRQTINYSAKVVLITKLIRFVKRSILRYFIGSLLFSSGLTIIGIEMNFTGLFLIVFVFSLVLGLMAIVVSSFHPNSSKIIKSGDFLIKYNHLELISNTSDYHGLVKWCDVNEVRIGKDMIGIRIDRFPLSVMYISRKALSDEEDRLLIDIINYNKQFDYDCFKDNGNK